MVLSNSRRFTRPMLAIVMHPTWQKKLDPGRAQTYIRKCIDMLDNPAETWKGSKMRFEWDESKNHKNIRRHKVSFELAREVFHDPLCLTIENRTQEGEERFWTIGSIQDLVVLIVVHTTYADEHGEEVIRIISARKVTPRERT